MEPTAMNLRAVKIEIITAIHNCSQRGLYQTVKWLSELNWALSHVKLRKHEIPLYEESQEDLEQYLVAKSYFDCKEYDRCAFYLENCESNKAKFLYYYASYLSIEKTKMDNLADSNSPPDPKKDKELRDLASKLLKDNFHSKMDGYLQYLYGVILKKLDASYLATEVLLKSIDNEPMLWCSWFELGKLVEDFSILPKHWMRQFFIVHACLEQLRNDEAHQMCRELGDKGFYSSIYLKSQRALCQHNNRCKYLLKHQYYLGMNRDF